MCKVALVCLTLRDPVDCSLAGSSGHGIFQARILEWVAIFFTIKELLLLLLLSPPGSVVPGILQARTLEWIAISFSNAWKWKVKSENEVTQSCPTLRNPTIVAYQAPPPMGFSRREYWSGVPLPCLERIKKYSLLSAKILGISLFCLVWYKQTAGTGGFQSFCAFEKVAMIQSKMKKKKLLQNEEILLLSHYRSTKH